MRKYSSELCYNSSMENFPITGEREVAKEIECVPPVVDLLKNADLMAEIFPDYAVELKEQIEAHNQAAKDVTTYLDQLEVDDVDAKSKNQYYEGVAKLLQNPDLQRLVLFLPFESYPGPADNSDSAMKFRESFVSAWSQLLYAHDARANFVDGDVLEVDARSEDPKRIVKAAHLTPWVVKSGIVELDEVIDFVADVNDSTLSRSLLDTEPLLRDFGLVSPENAKALAELQAGLPPRSEPLPPKFISPKRQAWLAERDAPIIRPSQRLDDLSQNLSERLPKLSTELAMASELATSLDPEMAYNVVMLGGSRLKGYKRESSDLDLFVPSKTSEVQVDGARTVNVDAFSSDPARLASVAFDTAWIGDAESITKLQKEILPIYFSEQNQAIRNQTTERLEQDLLEYRLLHKGFAHFYPDANPEYKKYTQMDGQSVFYETSYRVVATKIFANSIFVPRLNEK